MINPPIPINNCRSIRWYQQRKLHFGLILLLGLFAYANTFTVPFYFDDLTCIVDNPVVHDLSRLAQLGDYRQLDISEDIRNSIVTRFVTYLTFAGNYRLHGLAMVGYHLVNLLLHLANALLIYQLVRCARNPLPEQTNRSDGLALVVALLFATHPVQTSAVTYIVQRFAVLATFFALVALCAYALAIRSPSPGRRKGWYASALAATVLAMYSKEIAFTLPLLIALFDWSFLAGESRQRLRRLAPFFSTMFLLPLTVMSLANISAITGQSAANALELANIGGGSRWSYFFTQWPVIITYLRLLIFPSGLHLDYDFPLFTTLWDPVVLASGLILLALLALGLWLLIARPAFSGNDRNRRLAGFGLIWFFVTLSMESSLIPLDDLIFEYRLYLPSFGFFLAGTIGGDWLRQHFARKRPAINTVAVVGVTLLLVSLTIATLFRNHTWQDELVFWQDNVNKSPNRARPRCNLAQVYLKQRNTTQAIIELETAGRLNPNYCVPFEMLGDLRWNMKLYRLAAADYDEAGRRGNRSRQLLLKLGRSLRRSGNRAAAQEILTSLLAVDPTDAEALTEMAALRY